ncbi:hypothetical protein B0H10DRAFT_2243447 [Mycena sp. CBHHK59/15]|nr:hypothetical protein B0H10DRAFT_2243447 [Mycena sp. CBHHK59/15]
MAPASGPLWAYFHSSTNKPNGVHYRVTHWRCIDTRRPAAKPIDVDASVDVTLIQNATWFADALASAIAAKCDVNGEKKAMAGHLRRCAHATVQEKAAAAKVNPTKAETKTTQVAEGEAAKRAREATASDADDKDDTGHKCKKVKAIEKSFKQSKLEVFKGLDIPFNASQKEAIHAQFLCAMQSANLPEMWTTDAKILKLFMMFRLRAGDIIPSRTQLGGSLLKDACDRIDAEIMEELNGEDVIMSTDGWRSNQKDVVDGMSVSHKFKLILAEYLQENPKAAQIFEELIESVNWINSKDKVCDIFDKTQLNLCFVSVKGTIHGAILNKCDVIVAVHIGAESNLRKRTEMCEVALAHCATLEPNTWWDELKKIIPDLKHICYLTNIAQSDHVRPDQFLLALAGLFLHFAGFSDRSLAEDRALGKHMCARIEKRVKELDQAMFFLALVVNPFQKLSRFGDKANIDPFVLSTELIALYKRVKSRPPSTPRTPEQQQQHDKKQKQDMQSLSAAFMQYLSGTGPFANWENTQIQETYIELNAGLERSFSDFVNKKNKKRNHLGLTKMAQQSKVMRDLRNKQYAEGLVEKHDGRTNHSDQQVKLLLAVPRYAEALRSNTDDSDAEVAEQVWVLVKSKAAWHKQTAKWEKELREEELERDADGSVGGDDEDDDKDLPPTVSATPRTCRHPSWFPMTLAKLFGSAVARPIGKPARRPRVVLEEALYMELLAAEHSDEEPDAGLWRVPVTTLKCKQPALPFWELRLNFTLKYTPLINP